LDYIVFGQTFEQSTLKLTDTEYTLLNGFRMLDDRDKEDIIGNIHQKIENSKKGDIISNTENA